MDTSFLTTRRHFMARALGAACITLPTLLGGAAAFAARVSSSTEFDFTYYPRPSGPRGRCGRTTLLALQPKGAVATTVMSQPVIYVFYDGMTGYRVSMEITGGDIYAVNIKKGLNKISWPTPSIDRENSNIILFKSKESSCVESMSIKYESRSDGKRGWLEEVDNMIKNLDSKKGNLEKLLTKNDLSEVLAWL